YGRLRYLPSFPTRRSSDLEMHTAKGTVIYPGHVNNVDEWVAGSSVFVLPSYYREGVPRSTQEAMAIGRAVITTDVPGCRETVVEDRKSTRLNSSHVKISYA